MINFSILGLFCLLCKSAIADTCNDGATQIPSAPWAITVDHYPYRYMISESTWTANKAEELCLDSFKGQSLITLRNEFEYNNLLELINGKTHGKIYPL